MGEPTACPQCGRSDRLRRVRELVDQAATAAPQEGATHRRIDHGTVLAGQLHAPLRPRWASRSRVGCTVLLISTVIAVVVAVVGGLAAAMFFGNYYADAAQLSPRETAVYAGIILFMLSFAAVFFLAFFVQQRREGEQLRQRMSDWKRAMQRWEHLHYCERCESVYIPALGTWRPVSQMRELLYEHDNEATQAG